MLHNNKLISASALLYCLVLRTHYIFTMFCSSTLLDVIKKKKANCRVCSQSDRHKSVMGIEQASEMPAQASFTTHLIKERLQTPFAYLGLYQSKQKNTPIIARCLIILNETVIQICSLQLCSTVQHTTLYIGIPQAQQPKKAPLSRASTSLGQ